MERQLLLKLRTFIDARLYMNFKPANLILPVLMAFPLPCASQPSSPPARSWYYPGLVGTPSRNYVLEYTSTSGDEYGGVTKVTYLDGMGRPVESVTGGIAPRGTGIVEVYEYDALGRQSRKWLGAPFANPKVTGYVPLPSATAAISSHYGDASPYSSAEYEPWRSGKILSERRPGELSRRADAARTYSYSANDAASPLLSCRSYIAVCSGDCDVRVTDCGGSPSGSYMVRRTDGFDGSETYEFTDRSGRLYLHRRICGKKTADTYYLRDGSGSLLAVLPPELSEEGLSAEAIEDYAYLYSYDSRHRQSAAKRPGCAWKRTRSDLSGRLILEQDGNMLKKGISLFHLYDRHGRECLTGTCLNSVDDASWRDGTVYCEYTGETGTLYGYAVSGIALDNPAVLKADYYDSYDYLSIFGNDLSFRPDMASAAFKTCPASLLTGSVRAILGSPDSGPLLTAIYYDDRSMPLQTVSTNVAGGVDVENMAYTEGGLLSWRTLRHETPRGKTATERYDYTYDNAGRETSSAYSLDYCGQTLSFPLSSKEYDFLGRLSKDTRSTSSGRQMSAEYRYDMTGAINETLHPLYSQRLYREDSSPMGSERHFGGRVSATTWRTADNVAKERGYSYGYDSMGRLTEAKYYEDGEREEKYGTAYEYSLGGNATYVHREGLVGNGEYDNLDELSLQYDGGRLTRVIDLGADSNMSGSFQFRSDNWQTEPYSYDSNGNMTKDLYKDITRIDYNILDLPERITYSTGEEMSFCYDADGRKVRSVYRIDMSPVMPPAAGGDIGLDPSPVPKTQPAESAAADIQSGGRLPTHVSWCGNVEYSLGMLSRIYFDGGYVSLSVDGKTLADHHYVTDWQGNVRVVSSADGRAEQVNHYYPYGGLFGESTAPNGQRRRYGGKELDRTHGLDWYYYGARWYDAVLCRWTTRDAFEGKYPWLSAYGFCADDPVNNVDPDGNDWYKGLDGTYQFLPYVHSQKDLDKGRMYVGRSFTLGTRGNKVYYRSDGSILFDNETAAYNRMWRQADEHYRKLPGLEKVGREVGAFLLTNGKVLVLPDYANEYDTSKIGEYGYMLNGTNVVSKGEESFRVLAQIHTHQKGTGGFEVSTGDVNVSELLGARPVFAMHWDGNLYVMAQNSLHSMNFRLYNKLNKLLRGKFKLFDYVTNRSWNF